MKVEKFLPLTEDERAKMVDHARMIEKGVYRSDTKRRARHILRYEATLQAAEKAHASFLTELKTSIHNLRQELENEA